MMPPVRILASRVDALVVRVAGDLRPGVTSEVMARLDDARRAGVAGATVALGGVPYVVERLGRPEWWRAASGSSDIAVRGDGAHLAGWGIEIRARATALATRGLAQTIRDVRALAHVLCRSVDRIEARRIDLATDVVGLPPAGIDPAALAGPSRVRAARYTRPIDAMAHHTRAVQTLGHRIGSHDISMRIYDKTQELCDVRDDAKRQIEESIWSRARDSGDSLWHPGVQVTRVELQLRGDILDEMLDRRLRDLDTLPDALDAAWAYGTRTWLRIVDLSTSSRRSRCETDARWSVIQSATYGGDVAAIPVRLRRRGLAGARYALGVLASYVAGRGAIPDRLIDLLASDDAAVEYVDRLRSADAALGPASDDLVVATGRGIVDDLVRAAAGPLWDDLAEALGPARCLALLLERARSARARALTLDEVEEASA